MLQDIVQRFLRDTEEGEFQRCIAQRAADTRPNMDRGRHLAIGLGPYIRGEPLERGGEPEVVGGFDGKNQLASAEIFADGAATACGDGCSSPRALGHGATASYVNVMGAIVGSPLFLSGASIRRLLRRRGSRARVWRIFAALVVAGGLLGGLFSRAPIPTVDAAGNG